jgi:hypothetical protein
VPAPIEGTVLAHPFVRGVVAFGRERSQVGLLVEPTEVHAVDPTDEGALTAFRNEIWDAVEAANRSSPTFGRVYKEMILVTKPDKPLPRAGKGTVQKKAALKIYDDEIEALYVLHRVFYFGASTDRSPDMTPSSVHRRVPTSSRLQPGTTATS